MRIVNVLVIILISGVLGFLSLSFFFGMQRQHITLIHEIPSTVLKLYTVFPIVGIVIIALLTLINWTLNKGLQHEHPVKLKNYFSQDFFRFLCQAKSVAYSLLFLIDRFEKKN